MDILTIGVIAIPSIVIAVHYKYAKDVAIIKEILRRSHEENESVQERLLADSQMERQKVEDLLHEIDELRKEIEVLQREKNSDLTKDLRETLSTEMAKLYKAIGVESAEKNISENLVEIEEEDDESFFVEEVADDSEEIEDENYLPEIDESQEITEENSEEEYLSEEEIEVQNDLPAEEEIEENLEEIVESQEVVEEAIEENSEEEDLTQEEIEDQNNLPEEEPEDPQEELEEQTIEENESQSDYSQEDMTDSEESSEVEEDSDIDEAIRDKSGLEAQQIIDKYVSEFVELVEMDGKKENEDFFTASSLGMSYGSQCEIAFINNKELFALDLKAHILIEEIKWQGDGGDNSELTNEIVGFVESIIDPNYLESLTNSLPAGISYDNVSIIIALKNYEQVDILKRIAPDFDFAQFNIEVKIFNEINDIFL